MGLILLYVYSEQIVVTNASRGFEPLALDLQYWLCALAGGGLAALVTPTAIRRPSDFFAFVYTLFGPFTFAVLHPVVGRVDVDDFALRYALLMLPVFATYAAAASIPALSLSGLLRARPAEFLLLAACLVITVVAFIYRPESAGFDPDTTGDRRLEGREILAAGSLMAYAVSMMTNGLLPFLSFVGALRRERFWPIVAIAMAVVVYYLLGSKAQFGYIGLAYFVGRALDKGTPRLFHRIIFLSLFGAFGIFLIERQFWEHTLSGEYLFRRAFVIPPQVAAYYFDFMSGDRHNLWSLWLGSNIDDGLTFWIGEQYFGLSFLNVNTNAFIYALAVAGLPGYLGTVILTSAVFGLIDSGYKGSGNWAFFYLGFLYAILLVEQAATTALLTSGIGLLGLVVAFSGKGWGRKPLAMRSAGGGACDRKARPHRKFIRHERQARVNSDQPVPGVDDARDGVHLLDVAVVLAENRTLLIVGSLLIGLIALAIAFVIPPSFTATVKLLPPQQQQSSIANALTAQLGPLANLAGGALGVKNPADQYVALLKSRTVYNAMVDKFKLRELYKVEFIEDARKELEGRARITAGLKDGVISIEVDDHDPKRAAEMANAWVEQLKLLTNDLAVTEAGQRRLFFEQQLKQVKEDLVKSETALRTSGVNEETLKILPHSALESIARLKAQISAQEIRLSSMRSYMTETNPEYRMALGQLAALKTELAKEEQTTNSKVGAVGGDYVTKYRDFKYNELLFELMARQFEMARLDEAREGAVIQVVDRAQPPERKSKPKRAIISVIATILGFIFLAIFCVTRAKVREMAKDPDMAAKLARIGLRTR